MDFANKCLAGKDSSLHFIDLHIESMCTQM